MRKLMAFVLSLTFVLALDGCGGNETYEIGITIPAGSTEAFVYSHEEICPAKNTIMISSGKGLSDTEVVLKEVGAREDHVSEPTYLTPGMPVKMAVEKGAWFKVGVSMQNPSNEDITVTVKIQNLKEVRIE